MSRTHLLGALALASIVLGVSVPAAAAAPISLLLPQSNALSILGRSCGGIQELSYATGFDAVTGYPTGVVSLQTRCGGSGRGGGYKTTTYSAWAEVTWDFAGGVVSYARLAAAPAVDPAFSATDAKGDQLANSGGRASLTVPPPSSA